jgi:hypothetical protein
LRNLPCSNTLFKTKSVNYVQKLDKKTPEVGLKKVKCTSLVSIGKFEMQLLYK